MRRRWVGITFCVILSVFTLAMATAWVVSYYRYVEVCRYGTSVNGGVSITVSQFGIWYEFHSHIPAADGKLRYYTGEPSHFYLTDYTPAATDLKFLRFRMVHQDPFSSGPYTLINLPMWFLTSLGVILTAWTVIRLRRRLKRIDENCCLVCGYDLRATPDRCPECGTVPVGLAIDESCQLNGTDATATAYACGKDRDWSAVRR